MSILIKPTIGRKVWFRAPATLQAPAFAVNDDQQAMDATVIYVHSDRSVNLLVTDHRGNQHAMQSVLMLQGDEGYNPIGCYCEWMDFQKGQVQAAKVAVPTAPGAPVVGEIAAPTTADPSTVQGA